MLEDLVPIYSAVSTIILSTLCLSCLVHATKGAFKKNDPIWSYKTQWAYFILLIVSEARRIIVFLNYLNITDITLPFPKVNCYFLEMRISYIIAMGLDEVFRAVWTPLTMKWQMVFFILLTLLYPLPFMIVEYNEIFSLEIFETLYCLTHLCIMTGIIIALISRRRQPLEMMNHSTISKAVVIYLLIFITQMGIRIVFRWSLHEFRANDASTILDCTFKILIPITYLVIVGQPSPSSDSNSFKNITQKDNV